MVNPKSGLAASLDKTEIGNGAAAAEALEWRTAGKPVPYPEAVDGMERRVRAIREGAAPELVWLLEHPPLYTAGTSADDAELLDPGGLPVHRSGRGGRHTYHGPGQRVAYVMLDLNNHGRDLRRFVASLEQWIIDTLLVFGVSGGRREGRIGIWVEGDAGAEAKIAALGVRVRHWVTFHGVSINVDPDLGFYRGIIPCGIADYGVTSLAALGVDAGMAEVDAALQATFAATFGG